MLSASVVIGTLRVNIILRAGADPGILDREFIFAKGEFDLTILPAFSQNSSWK